MIASYTGLLVELNRLIYGDEVSASDIPTATLKRIVSLGERRIYRELRCRYNEKTFSGSVSGNLFALPNDYEVASVVHFGRGPLEPVAENFILERQATNQSGRPLYFAQAGNNLTFWPAAPSGSALVGRYYARLPDLSADTLADNALFAVAEDLFVYAALSKSAPFFSQDNRVPVWESEYQRIRDGLNQADARGAYSAGRLRMRPSASGSRSSADSVSEGESGEVDLDFSNSNNSRNVGLHSIGVV